MFTEIMILSATGMYLLKKDDMKVKKKWNKIMASKSEFWNDLNKTLKILDIDKTDNSLALKLELPYGYTNGKVQNDLEIFREGMGYDKIRSDAKGNIVTLIFENDMPFKQYQIVPLLPYQLLIADGVEPVDMNKFPHMIVSGDTGTGKTRLLMVTVTNLIATTKDEIEMHLIQRRKSDLGVFKNCIQVKSFSKQLYEILETLKEIDLECERREELITPETGIYSIVDYNYFKDDKLKYLYVVIEEFSFLNESRGDSKEESELKEECLKHIKNIINVGRSSGVFIITALQKPTADSIPSDIKAQMMTRVSLKFDDPAPAIVVMGNANSTKLKEREVIVKTLGEQTGKSYTLWHQDIMKAIGNKIEKKPQKKPKILELLGVQNEIDE